MQALAFCRQRFFNIFEGCTGPHRQHQLNRVILHNAGVTGQAQGLGVCAWFTAHERLAAAANNIQLVPVLPGLKHLLLQLLNLISHGWHPPVRVCVACVQ